MAKTSYVLSKRIARGGMAEIYLGKAVGEDSFQRICAIKRILPHYAQDREFIEMFRDEAHICKRLQHANIVQVYDFTEVEGSFALVMEFVDGADLRSLLAACEAAKIRLSVPVCLFIGACVARALHYAHTKVDEITNEALGIVHRDISPQNILISFEGEVKITDFGIASAENKITETRPGVVKGKYSYMSPEQVAAKPLDGRSDVFSMAIVLWECLAMKRLFAGQSEVETIRKVQNCEIGMRLTDLNPEITPELEEIVLRGLLKDRKRRYQTAAQFEKMLLKYLHSKYPDFVESELGNFLKRILAGRHHKSQMDIKEALTHTDLRKSSTTGALPEKIQKEHPVEVARQQRAASHDTGAIALDDTRNRKLEVNNSFHSVRNTRTGAIRAAGQPAQRPARPHPSSFSMPARRARYQEFRVTPSGGMFKFLILTALIVLGIFAYNRRQALMDDKMHLELKSEPETITMKLNGKALNNGAYTRTPAVLHMVPGKHQLVVGHEGYLQKIVDFQGSAGDTLKPPTIYLQRDPGIRAANVLIKAPGNKKITYTLNSGQLTGNTPSTLALTVGKTHVLTYQSGDKGGKKQLRCTFKLPNAAANKNYAVTVDPDHGGRCRAKPSP